MQFGGQPTPWSEVEIEGLRLRSVSQILIQEIGAAGPENAEESARRACGVIQRMADQIVSADARIAELELDAARYRWLRRRVRLAREEMMSGAIKECLTVRMAWSSLERKDDPADGYFSQDRFNYECDALDAAIDAARAGNGGGV